MGIFNDLPVQKDAIQKDVIEKLREKQVTELKKILAATKEYVDT